MHERLRSAACRAGAACSTCPRARHRHRRRPRHRGPARAAGRASRPTARFTRVHTAHVETVHTEPRIVTNDDVPVVLHTLDYEAHGGLARVEWYDGAWAPLVPDAGCYVTLFVDDRPVASRAARRPHRASTRRDPAALVWVGHARARTGDARGARRACRRGLRHPPGLGGASDHRRPARDGVGVTALRLGLLALLAGAVAVAALARPSEPHPPQFAQAHDVRAADTSHKLFTGPDRAPELLHRLELETRCPTLAIEWTSTNVEPTTPDSWAIVELRLDGRVVPARVLRRRRRRLRGRPGSAARGAVPRRRGRTPSRRGCTAVGPSPPGACPTPTRRTSGSTRSLAQDDPPAGARPATCAA